MKKVLDIALYTVVQAILHVGQWTAESMLMSAAARAERRGVAVPESYKNRRVLRKFRPDQILASVRTLRSGFSS